MRIEFSVCRRDHGTTAVPVAAATLLSPDVAVDGAVDGAVDVAVDAPAATVVGVLLAELGRLAGAAAGDLAWLDGRPLAIGLALSDCGLRNGAMLVFAPKFESLRQPATHVVHVIAGAAAGSSIPLSRAGLTMGRDEGCDLVIEDDRVSRRHARLEVTRSGPRVRDLGSTNGTRVDGAALSDHPKLVTGAELIVVGDAVLSVRSGVELSPASVVSGRGGGLRVERSLGARPARPTPVTLRRPEGAAVTRPGRVHWLAAVMTGALGGALALTLASPMFLLMVLLSPFMLLTSALGDRLHWRRQRRRAAAAARREAAGFSNRVSEALRDETRLRRSAVPDSAALTAIARLPGTALWSRERDGHDTLLLRVGTCDAAAETRIIDDSGAGSAGTLHAVPLLLDLRTGPVGIIGAVCVGDAVARWLVAQLAVLHRPADLCIALLHNPEEDARWHWLRWLPHLRLLTCPADDHASLPGLPTLAEHLNHTWPSPGDGGPRRIVVIADRLGAEAADELAQLLRADAGRVTAVCLADTAAALPPDCATTVEVVSTGSRLLVSQPADVATSGEDRAAAPGGITRTDAALEGLPLQLADSIARCLAAYRDPSDGHELPSACQLVDLLPCLDSRLGPRGGAGGTPEAVRDHWRSNAGAISTPIGVSRDGPLRIDLDVDGPHALITGTTGAGKSELLRSLVLGLAVAASPADTSFLLIDYKGGAAFTELTRLRHCTGVLTDLDPALTRRALRSLGAELRRRERIFAGAGAADLTAYRAASVGDPVARLVIVVDEFAELAADQPDFLAGLVGVARRGRSLGVHLVLATQRPGAAVTPEIRANASLRITLRVTEPAESLDMIGVPDAARIGSGLPGRGFVRTGDHVVPFQATRVAAGTGSADRPVVEALQSWRQQSPTRFTDQREQDAAARELERLVDLLNATAAGQDDGRPHPAWLPPLPASIPLAEVRAPTPVAGALALGRIDLPDMQAQPTLALEPDDSSVLVVGRPRSGRTTALTTIALATAAGHDASTLDIHLIDGSGTLIALLAQLPHLATAAGSVDHELVAALLRRLAEPTGDRQQSTLLLIDAWDQMLSTVDETTAARWSNLMSAIVASSGPELRVVVTGGRDLLAPRVASQFRVRLLLPLNDAADYTLAGVPAAAVPDFTARALPGRGVLVPDGAVVQLAHPGSRPEAAAVREAVAELAEIAELVGTPSTGKLRLRALPTTISLGELRTRVAPTPGSSTALLLGIAGERARPCPVDLLRARVPFLVAGPPRSGRSTVLLTLAAEARRAGGDVVVWAPVRSPLHHDADSLPEARRLDGDTPTPRQPTLVVIDDLERCDDLVADKVLGWLREGSAPVAVVAACRSDDIGGGYLPLPAALRRERFGVLLRPGPRDADLFGLRHTGVPPTAPPGRGLLIADPRWCPLATGDGVLPIQIAATESGAAA